MALRFSTGLRNGMLNAAGLKELFTNGVLDLYSGAQPAAADNAVQGTKLLRITVDGGAFNPGSPTNGLNFDDPAAGAISKAAAEAWSGLGLADGTTGWFRFKGNALDDDGVSATLPRIDGSVAKTGGDLAISNPAVVTGSPQVVATFNITLKASG